MLVSPLSFSFGLDSAVQSLRRASPYAGPLRTQDRVYDIASRQANGGSRVDPRQADSLGYSQASSLQGVVKAFEGVKQNIVFGQKAITDAKQAVATVKEMLGGIRDKVIAYRDNDTSAEEKRQIANEVITLQTRIEGTITRAQSQGVNLLSAGIKKVIDSTPAQLAARTTTKYEVDLNGDGAFDVSYDGTSSNSLTLTPGGESGTTGGVLANSTKSALLSINTDLTGASDVNVNLQSALSAYQNGQQTSNGSIVQFQAPGFGGSGGGSGGDDDDDDRHRNEIGRGHDEDWRTRHGHGYGYGHHGDDDGGGGGGGVTTTARGQITSTGTLSLATNGSATNPSGATSIATDGTGLTVDFNGDGVNDLTINTTNTSTLATSVTDNGDTSIFGGTGSTQTNTSIVYTATTTTTGGTGGGDDDDDHDHGHGNGHGNGHGDDRDEGHGQVRGYGYAYGRGGDYGHGDHDGGGGTTTTTTTTAVNVATSSSATFDGSTGRTGSQTGGTSSTFAVDRDGDGTSDFAVRVTTTTTYDYSGFGSRTISEGRDAGLPVFGEAAGVTDVPGTEFSTATLGSNEVNLSSAPNTALDTVEKALKKADLTNRFLDNSAERLALQDKQISDTIEAAKGGVETIFKADEEKAKAVLTAAEQRQELVKKAVSEGATQAKALGGLLVNVQADVTQRQGANAQNPLSSSQASQAYGKVASSPLPPIRTVTYPLVAPTQTTQARETAAKADPYALPAIDAIA